MKFFDSPCFSLKMDGQSVVLPAPQIIGSSREGRTEIYALPGGLTVTRQVRLFPQFSAAAHTLWLENTGSSDSALISDLNDLDAALPMFSDGPWIPGYTAKEPCVRILTSKGSMCDPDDFRLSEKNLHCGSTAVYESIGGRSCQPYMPFFDLNQGPNGYIMAIGWTGTWSCSLTRTEDAVQARCGIQNLSFRLHPGEKIRTSQMLVLSYTGGQTAGHNQLRRLIKAHYTPANVRDHEKTGALNCMMLWGGTDSEKMVRRIESAKRHELGFDYLWIDAGWYGHSVQECPSEFTGDWHMHTGSWNVNPTYHPNGLQDVRDAIEKAGMKFMLWLEPERAIQNTDWASEHPDWFLYDGNPDEKNVLMNMGKPEACQACIDMVSNYIETLHLSIYRQDYNIDPLRYWNHSDEPERKGLTEIYYILGVYRFWDALLERFPHLIIDNCASGGRRIDIEMCSRSIPMWRTDYTCVWDFDPEMEQGQQGCISYWIPYSGAGNGKVMLDSYRTRSCFGGSLNVPRWGYEQDPMEEDEKSLAEYDFMRRMNAEFKRISPYMNCDYYPLSRPTFEKNDWTMWQYDRPEHRDGVVMAFRRSESPLTCAAPVLGGLAEGAVYCFTDADTGESFELSADELAKNGLSICLPQVRSCKVLFYTVK